MIKKLKIPKLALEFTGYIFNSIAIAVFSFAFLYFMSITLINKNVNDGYSDISILSDPEFTYWVQLLCIIAALVVFFTFLLLFIGQKISYILSITNAIEILKEGNLNYKIEIIGDDELTVLADSINSFSIALRSHKENEDKLKKEKEALIRSLSHDIKTPLTSIISYSDFIKNKKYDNIEKLESYVDIIQNKAYQIQDLTSLILNPTPTINKVNDECVDGKLMFEQFISEFSDSLIDNDFKVAVNSIGLISFNAKFNPQDIARIFDNLYSNIIKYADKDKKIEFQTFIMDETLILTQTNKIKRNHVNVDSNGIGLKNIQQLVESYKGNIKVFSNSKTFKIEIKLPINL